MAAKAILLLGRARRILAASRSFPAVRYPWPQGPQRRDREVLRRPAHHQGRVTVAKEIELAEKSREPGRPARPEVASKQNDLPATARRPPPCSPRPSPRRRQGRAAGLNPLDLKRGIDLGVEAVVNDLKTHSKKVTSNDEIAQVGTISANGDTFIGSEIAKAVQKVGNEGVSRSRRRRASRPRPLSSRACSSTAAISRLTF